MAHILGGTGNLPEEWASGKNLRNEAMHEVLMAKFS